MFRLFSKIRQTLLSENRFSKYLIYALGEIVLVVIGILIALEINNKNDARKEREKEIHYLENIKRDLNLNIQEIDRMIELRTNLINSSNQIIEHFEGRAIENHDDFNALALPIFAWQRYYQKNNTFLELVNSGNFSVITNDNIKNMLMDIETLYKAIKYEEDHYRFDVEETFYKPMYQMIDLNPQINSYTFKMSNGAAGKDEPLTPDYYQEFMKSNSIKNGFILTVFQYTVMNGQMNQMKSMSQDLIQLIDEEISN